MNFGEVKREIRLDYWLEHVVFSWRWWLLIALLTIPWFIWWKVINRKRLPELTLVALFTLIIAVVFDEIETSKASPPCNRKFSGYSSHSPQYHSGFPQHTVKRC